MTTTAVHPDHRHNGFDLIRLALAATVMLSHAIEYREGDRRHEPLTMLFHTLSFGELAVDGFFILSGFLVLQSWDRAPSLPVFLRKRAVRLYPAFAAASVFCLLLVGPLGVADPLGYLQAVNGREALARIVLLLPPSDSPAVFAGMPYPFLNSPAWTVHYEFGCYLMLAGVGALGLLRGRLAPVLLWVAALAWYLAEHGLRPDGLATATFYDLSGSLARFSLLFLSGVVCARLALHTRRAPVLCGAAAVALIAGLCVPVLAEAAVATAGAYLLLAGGSAFSWRRTMPDISYGAYLYGGPVEMLIAFHLRWLPGPGVLALALPVALAMGAVSWRLIEAPALRRLPGRSRQGRPVVQVGLTATA